LDVSQPFGFTATPRVGRSLIGGSNSDRKKEKKKLAFAFEEGGDQANGSDEEISKPGQDIKEDKKKKTD
jgi:hypothetical protein